MISPFFFGTSENNVYILAIFLFCTKKKDRKKEQIISKNLIKHHDNFWLSRIHLRVKGWKPENLTNGNTQQRHTTEFFSSNNTHEEDSLEGFTELLLTDLAVNKESVCTSSSFVKDIRSQDVEVEDITFFTLVVESLLLSPALASNWLRGLKSMMGEQDDTGCLSLLTAFSRLWLRFSWFWMLSSLFKSAAEGMSLPLTSWSWSLASSTRLMWSTRKGKKLSIASKPVCKIIIYVIYHFFSNFSHFNNFKGIYLMYHVWETILFLYLQFATNRMTIL